MVGWVIRPLHATHSREPGRSRRVASSDPLHCTARGESTKERRHLPALAGGVAFDSLAVASPWSDAGLFGTDTMSCLALTFWWSQLVVAENAIRTVDAVSLQHCVPTRRSPLMMVTMTVTSPWHAIKALPRAVVDRLCASCNEEL